MSAKEMLKEFGYELDKETRFGALVSYTHYCVDGCCRINDLLFYENGIHCEETFITLDFLKAINQQCKELNLLNEE